MLRKLEKKSPATTTMVNRARTKNARASKSDLPQSNPKCPSLQVSLAAHGGGKQKRQPSTRSQCRGVLTDARTREIEEFGHQLNSIKIEPPTRKPDCKPLPAVTRMKELLLCDATAGSLHHKIARGGRAAGSRAGLTNPEVNRGYCQVYIDGKAYRTHRVIWKLVTGKDPVGVIDHINGDTTDNRFENLRDVSVLENNRNRHAVSSNVGHLGVSFCKKSKRYLATISVGNRNYNIGKFHRLTDAVKARKIVADIVFGDDAQSSAKSKKRRAA